MQIECKETTPFMVVEHASTPFFFEMMESGREVVVVANGVGRKPKNLLISIKILSC